MEFKYILKDLREENGISQKQLAKECGLSPQCISALEKGINSPTFQTLSALKKYFGNQLNDYFVNNEITPGGGKTRNKKNKHYAYRRRNALPFPRNWKETRRTSTASSNYRRRKNVID